MGTRAMIRVNGKPTFATHWDGQPDSLGEDLVDAPKTMASIRGVAAEHSINFASASQLAASEKLMKSLIRGKSGYEWAFKPGATFVGRIKDYNDFAEYEYDVNTKTGVVRVRERHGSWKDNRHGSWRML